MQYQFITCSDIGAKKDKETKNYVIEIDIDEKWHNILSELDEEEEENENRNHNRHSSLEKLFDLYEIEFGEEDKDIKRILGYDTEVPKNLFTEEMEEKLQEAILGLKDDYQDLIYHFFYLNKTKCQIARERGVSEGAIRKKMKTIIKHLEKALS